MQNMKIRLTKQNKALIPFDTEAEAVIAKWKDGDFLELDVKRPRNSQHHRKLFAMLSIVLENTDEFVSIDELLEFVKIKAGIYKIVKVGNVHYPITQSISFAKMSQDEFGLFYSNAIDACLSIIPLEKEELANQIAMEF